MGFEVINILTLLGTSKDVNEVVCSFNIDDGDVSTLLAPNKLRFYSDRFCPLRDLTETSKNFPTVKIKVEFADEDLGQNVGSFYIEDGEISNVVSPKGGSDEAYEMSMEITGDEFYVTQFLYGLSEDEITEEFPDMCIKLAFKLRKCNPSYPPFILKKFEQWAVEVEDYEFASQVAKDKLYLNSNLS